MRHRLVVSAAALVLTALLAFALPLALAVRGLVEQRALDGLQGTVEPIALVLDASSRTCAELQLRVAQLADLPLAFTVVTTDGQLVVTTAAGGSPALGGELVDAAAGRPGRVVDPQRVAVAMRLSTQVCGQGLLLHAAGDAAPVRTQVRGAWLLIAGVAGGVAALAGAIAWVLGRRLAQPFERLATSAARLGEGDFTARAPRSGLEEADRIADALDDTAGRLGRSVDRANAFAADASHQLRTPLTALRLHLESLAVGAPGPSVDAALEEADRLEATIEELVALTRPDAAAGDLDLTELVRERLPAWEDLAAQQGREVVFEALPVPLVRARPGAVGQALQVLLDNALRHARGRVTVRLAPALPSEPRGTVRLCVLDEGLRTPGPGGGAPATRGTTTSEEVRRGGRSGSAGARPGTREAERGLGAGGRGLPLARALVAAEGGELSLHLDPVGSAACLLLPAARERT
ncbi:sensor histidine kinase [Egicoccus halophilus]|uniref:histidine kinase n=1 Tax=Egicoccus halophilus TaxID=1670830 RepID=A0A8J3ABL3_9ACTN|nr:HAMP domain-containing sensor histidine kinase [Egicoccus halophilus]GGI09725.1 two-component sensor histidine kinase [Egicoccus halophilus]